MQSMEIYTQTINLDNTMLSPPTAYFVFRNIRSEAVAPPEKTLETKMTLHLMT